MKALVCDLCGGKLVMGSGGVAVCDSCGMEHSADRMKEKVQEIKGTVRVDNSHMVTTYLEMTSTALEAGNNEEAENYANKVIEIDSRNAKAWLYKGVAAGWQTTGRNNRYPESIVSWINAINFASDGEKEELTESIKTNAANIGLAILQMECNSFINYRTEDNKEDVTNALNMIESQLKLLKEKTEVEIYTSSFKTVLARAINNCAVDANRNTNEDFGPENRNRDEYKWRQFTASQDRCLDLLNKAYELSYDDELCNTICKNYIGIAEAVRDSCSYKWNYSQYNSDGYYTQEYAFTTEAKEYRTKTINNWKQKQEKHDPTLRKSNCKKAIELYNLSYGEENRKLAIAQYWESHTNEKSLLENELAEIQRKKADLKVEADNNSDKLHVERIDKEITSIRNQMNSLGFFKGKEKKALAAKIDELVATRTTYNNRWVETKNQLDANRNVLNKRISEINEEFTKDRGVAKITPKQNVTIFENGTGVLSALDLVSYHRNILPGNFTVKGEGEDAVQNYTRSMILQAKALTALFSALAGKKDAIDNMDLDYEDNPETSKTYRINFLVSGENSNISANFLGKTIDGPIGEFLKYELEEEKTPQAVANFIRLVISSVICICPSIDLTGLEQKIAEVAYGLSSEITINADNHICTIAGGTKRDLDFTIKPASSK